ncbi:MAG: hypothetical protein NZ903_00855 [Candidatus Micrarchaeota archaeon]|nr:hypothetical protein [Candidatus Micrarchaeota archaeon]
MKLPNIYEGNYSLLIVFPLILIVISLFLIPNLKYGIEFQGGILITVQTQQQISERDISSLLMENGITDFDVRVFQIPTANVAEIEIATDRRLLTIDDKLSELDKIVTEASEIESELARLRAEQQRRDVDHSAKIASKEEQLSALISSAKQIQSEIFIRSREIIGKNPSVKEETSDDVNRILKASNAVFAEAKSVYKERLITLITASLPNSDMKIEEVSPALSRLFVSKVLNIALIAALLAIVVVFLIFRTFLPSFAVLIGATSDIIMALGAMAFFGIPITLASFVTLMTLAALSLDTDMMLTIKTVKRKEGTPRERAYDAFRTGFAMTTTVIVAFAILMLLGLYTHIPTYYQIGAVAVAGLIGDLIATWCLNAVLVLWYLEGKYDNLIRMVKR